MLEEHVTRIKTEITVRQKAQDKLVQVENNLEAV